VRVCAAPNQKRVFDLRLQKRVVIGGILSVSLLALTLPTAVGAYRRWRDVGLRSQPSDFVETGDPEIAYLIKAPARKALEENSAQGPEEAEGDDALMRQMAWRNYYGPSTPEQNEELLRIAHEESSRWSALMPQGGSEGARQVVPGTTWVNLGPTDARFQYNFVEYLQVDSGRTTGILVHPRNPDIVYTATSGGGIWKTFNFSAKNPTWYPITETIGNLAIGNIALDPNAPDTLYAGLGDVFDVPGGQMIKTTDGGITWSMPVQLAGTYPPESGGAVVSAQRVRSVAVDPSNSNHVLVATDVGLFRSLDGGQTYALVDLPNSGTQQRTESARSIVFTGAPNGVSRWAVSGEVAGNVDIWISSDAGATWSSRRVAGSLPAVPGGRVDLAVGAPSEDGATTAIFAQVAEAALRNGIAIWRSTDSGATFVDATGSLRNPTLPAFGSSSCPTQLVQRNQASYNQAIAVDPGNANNVLIGGTLCAVRSKDALAPSPTWELVAHWLPMAGGDTQEGRLPYVHADWHRLTITRLANGSYLVIAGTDGGLFVSRTAFTSSPLGDVYVRWDFPNRGIVSHLFYHIASGDEVSGNPSVVFGGLQDNGTRFRDSPSLPTTFNQVIGGDGFGAAVADVPGDSVYWGSVYYVDTRVCDPDTRDCNRGENWSAYSPLDDYPTLPCPGDDVSGQFFTRVQPVRTATSTTGPAVVTLTDRGVWRYRGDPYTSTNRWELLGNPSGPLETGACTSSFHRNLQVSSAVDGLIGVAVSGGRYRVTSNCSLSAPATQCTWTLSSPIGVDLNGNGTVDTAERMSFTSSVDFPPGNTSRPLGDVYVTASVAPTTAANTPVPPQLGRLFITEDRGRTWRSLKGNGTSDLPNLPVHVVRYDTGDLTNRTLYAGTDLGVYRTTDGGQTWHRLGSGLPLVRVTDLFVSKTGAFLRAATYGRGLWEIYPSATADKGVNGNGDWDRNQQIDFQDILSLASRMGTSPATNTPPLYDWNQDVTGTVNAIDDADLAQVLSRLGGQP
jgi:hypothetical protein